jgi:DNA-binding SARP family transcriptional activator
MSIRILLFGAPSVLEGGVTTALPRERGSQLLVLLAHRRGWVPRHELAALLWPGHETKLALTNLRKALFRLQERPWGNALEVLPGTVRLDAETDVAAFDAAVGAGQHADALALRRGEWLQGFDDDANEPWTAWLHFERDRPGGRPRWITWLPMAPARPSASTSPRACWTPIRSTRRPCTS